MLLAASPADRDRPRLPNGVRERGIGGRLGLGHERDRVRQLGDRVQIAERRQPGESQRIQLVADQQRQVGIVGAHDPLGAVVQPRALDDHLEQQLVLLGVPSWRAARWRRAAPDPGASSSVASADSSSSAATVPP